MSYSTLQKVSHRHIWQYSNNYTISFHLHVNLYCNVFSPDKTISLKKHNGFTFHLALEDGRMVLSTTTHKMCICSDLSSINKNLFNADSEEIVSIAELGSGNLVSFTRRERPKPSYIVFAIMGPNPNYNPLHQITLLL